MTTSFLCILLCATPSDWPKFRGPDGSGTSAGAGLPEVWSATENVVWKADVAGLGWSSPVIWAGKVFLTSTINEGKDEEPKKGLYMGGNRDKPATAHRWVVSCIDAETGKTSWERVAHQGKPGGARHIKNSYASETPVVDDSGVYAYFGNVGLFAYDLSGKPLWSKQLGVFNTRYGWGTAASPALEGDRLYIVNDNEEKSFLVALDKKTGNELWRRPRDEKSNWATPFIWKNEGRTELVTAGTGRVRSYDLDGGLLWELAGMSSITICTPLAGRGLLFVGSGYVMDPQRPIYAVKPGAKGDITPKKDATESPYVAWHQQQAAPYNTSPLVYGDHLYVLYDRGFLECRDARTGKEVYGRQRLSPESTAFTASPWAYGGKVFCLSEDGDTFVVSAGSEFRVLRKNSVGEMCMATPAIAGKSLYLRARTKLYRIEDRGAAATRGSP